MYRIARSFLCTIAAAVCSLPAFALDPLALAADSRIGGEAAAICEVDADINQPILLVAYTGEAQNVAGARSPRAEAPEALPTEPGDSGGGRSGAGTAPPDTVPPDTVPPDTVLSLLHPGPNAPQGATRAVDNEQSGDWIRTAESTVPEPGLWAVLVAGFLGVCAMARPRIFSS